MSQRASPLLAHAGAVAAGGVDAGSVAHFGQPMREQRQFVRGDGWVDLSHRDVIRIEGPDRLTYLHAMTTQAFDALRPGHWVQALVLSPHGHIEHGFAGVDDGAAFTAHTEPGAGPALVTFLEQMKFMLRVETVSVDDLGVVATGAGLSFVPRDELSTRVGTPVGLWAYEALRIESGVPRIGLDSDHRTIPNELGLLETAVHLAKGCYRGQETVARVHNLGRPPRRLTLLQLDGSAEHLPEHGAVVSYEGREVGRVGTAARHYEAGPIALALVKRSVPVEATLEVRSETQPDTGPDTGSGAGSAEPAGPVVVAAAQEPIVDPEVGLHVRAAASR